MNKLFVDDLVERLESVVDTVRVCKQSEVLDYIDDYDYEDGCNHFPMLCFEVSSDNDFDVDSSESKFLYDSAYNGTWIIGSEDDINFIMCLKSNGNSLYIDAFEVNIDMRGQGIAGDVLSVLESVAENYFKNILITPFDSDAISFWEHMEFKEGNNGYWVKEL